MASPMHIFHVISNLGIGGAEIALCRLVEALPRDLYRHSVVSMLPDGPNAERLKAAGAHVFELGGKRSPFAASLVRQIVSIVRTQQPDLLQGWMYHGNIAATLAQIFGNRRVPIVWGVRQSLARLGDEKLLTRATIMAGSVLGRTPAAIIYNSRLAALQHERLHYPAEKTRIIANGIDVDQFQPSQAMRAQLREKLGLTDADVLIGRVARFSPMKDFPTLLASFEQVANQMSGLHLALVGTGVDGSNRELAELIASLESRARVHLLGEQRAISSIVPAFDVCVSSSSRSEGFPTVLAEAMACGVPTISTDVGDARLIIDDAARIVPPRNAQALAEALVAFTQLPPAERAALSVRDRRRIVENFGIDRFAQAFATVWRDASTGTGTTP